MKQLLSILIGLMCFTSTFAQLVVKDAKNHPVEVRIYVNGYGDFVTKGGAVDLKQELSNRANVRGFTLPEDVEIFIPPTATTSASIQKVSLKHSEIRLGSIADGEEQIWNFFYPEIVNLDGSLVDASIAFLGTTQKIDKNSRSVALPTGKKEVNVVVYAPGMEYVQQTLTLPTYEQGNHHVFKSTQLPPANNVVWSIVVASTQRYDSTLTHTASYFKKGGEYVWQTVVSDGKTVEYAHINLSQGSNQKIYLSSETSIDDSWTKVEDLPKEVPMVQARYDIAVAATTAKADQTNVPKASGVDTVWIFIFLFFGVAFVVFSGWIVYVYILTPAKKYRSSKERQRAEKTKQVLKELKVQSLQETVQKAHSLVKKASIPSHQELLLDAIHKVSSQIANAEKIFDQKGLIAERIKEFEDLIDDHYEQLQQAMDKDRYDLAMSLKATMEDTEEQLRLVKATEETIQQSLLAYGESLRTLSMVLDDIVIQVTLSERHSTVSERAKVCHQKLKEQMEDLQTAYETVQADTMTAKDVADLHKNRRKAQSEGISAVDINELKEFISKRKTTIH